MNSDTRVLLVEDDATTRAFMRAVIGNAGYAVDDAACAADALRCVDQRCHALWLIDAHLPDGAGDALLSRLSTARPGTLAIAHTASSDRALHTRLLEAGFARVLVKPLSASALRAAVSEALDRAPRPTQGERASPDSGAKPLWDEHAALAALNGQTVMVTTLRRLFIEELPAQVQRIVAAGHAGDERTLRAEAHRLLGSCGFVGAARLRDAAQALHASPGAATVADLLGVAEATLSACPDDGSPSTRAPDCPAPPAGVSQ